MYKGANPEHLRIALDSILAQTSAPAEIVLMEDGPLTEPLREVVRSFEDERTRVVDIRPEDDAETVVAKRGELLPLPEAPGRAASVSECASRSVEAAQSPLLVIGRISENVQLGRALAFGVLLCGCPLIARMDADDIALPGRLEVEDAFLDAHPEVSVLGGAIEEFDECGAKGVKSIPGGRALESYAKLRCPVNHMTVMMRRDDILRAGNYRHFPGLEDYELWSRVLARGYVLDNVPDVLVRARCESGFYDRRGGADYGRRYMRLRKMQKDWGLLNPLEYAKACCATAVMAYSPSSIRRILYLILRKGKTARHG